MSPTVTDVDLQAVRTFVTIADVGGFQAAGDELGISQQAVSKRIAALERALEVKLLARTARGACLTVDGQAFLPHARELLRAEDRAVASVAPARRALRVDVRNRRTAPATLLHAYYRQHDGLDLDVVVLPEDDVDSALRAVASGTVDASFRGLVDAPKQLAGTDLRAERVIEDPHQLLVGPRHPLANVTAVSPTDLAEHAIWMPGLPTDSEVRGYYDELATTFGLTIDLLGPRFGAEVLLTEIAESPTLANLIGERSRYLWPAHYDLRRIPVVDPTPVYPLWIIWHPGNPHPELPRLLAFLAADFASRRTDDVWLPTWAS